MMMPSTMILTICISMVLKRKLDIGSRYERAEHKTHNSNRYVGLAGSGLGGVEADPPDKNFSVTSVGVIFNQWGFKPSPTPLPRQIERCQPPSKMPISSHSLVAPHP